MEVGIWIQGTTFTEKEDIEKGLHKQIDPSFCGTFGHSIKILFEKVSRPPSSSDKRSEFETNYYWIVKKRKKNDTEEAKRNEKVKEEDMDIFYMIMLFI